MKLLSIPRLQTKLYKALQKEYGITVWVMIIKTISRQEGDSFEDFLMVPLNLKSFLRKRTVTIFAHTFFANWGLTYTSSHSTSPIL
jgi:hypothetical protein